MDQLEATLRRCFKAVFADLKDEEIPMASTASVGNWDSVAALSLMAVLEEELKTQIPLEEMEHLISYELLLDYLRSKHGAS